MDSLEVWRDAFDMWVKTHCWLCLSGALKARFPTTVQIPDFLATELVQFMEISASKLPSGDMRGFSQ